MDSLDKCLVIMKIYNIMLHTKKYYIAIKIFNLLFKIIYFITRYMYNKQLILRHKSYYSFTFYILNVLFTVLFFILQIKNYLTGVRERVSTQHCRLRINVHYKYFYSIILWNIK